MCIKQWLLLLDLKGESGVKVASWYSNINIKVKLQLLLINETMHL